MAEMTRADAEQPSMSADDAQRERKYFLKILTVFRSYATHCEHWLQSKQHQWGHLSSADRDLLPEYTAKLEGVIEAIAANSKFISTVVPPDPSLAPSGPVPEHEMEKLRSTLRQCVRDWSGEGAAERERTYGEVYRYLDQVYPAGSCDRPSMRVLVPGAGLGRMVFDLVHQGFTVEGNEFSFYMLLLSNYLLNRCDHVHEFTIYPWAHSFNNQVSAQHQLQAIRIPDILSQGVPDGASMSMSAGEFLDVYVEKEEWDVVVTCFFLDTAHNIIEYIRRIQRILKPGGRWVNIGPLLYHYEGMPGERSVELTLEEVLLVIRRLGFEVECERRLRTGYSCHTDSMLQYDYQCSFFAARKPLEPVIKK